MGRGDKDNRISVYTRYITLHYIYITYKLWNGTLILSGIFVNNADPERFRFARDTSFGRRHLNFWSKSTITLWIVSFFRQFFGSVTKVDYLTLRHGFIMVKKKSRTQSFDLLTFLLFKKLIFHLTALHTCFIFFFFFRPIWLPGAMQDSISGSIFRDH